MQAPIPTSPTISPACRRADYATQDSRNVAIAKLFAETPKRRAAGRAETLSTGHESSPSRRGTMRSMVEGVPGGGRRPTSHRDTLRQAFRPATSPCREENHERPLSQPQLDQLADQHRRHRLDPCRGPLGSGGASRLQIAPALMRAARQRLDQHQRGSIWMAQRPPSRPPNDRIGERATSWCFRIQNSEPCPATSSCRLGR
jgi:hypothetical protein